MKILVIQQKMIGDVLTSTILLEALRLNYPQAELHYLIHEHTKPVLENNPFIDKILVFTPELKVSKKSLWEFRKAIAETGYYAVIDVYSKLGSAFLTKASKALVRVGYEKWYTRFAYTHTYATKNSCTIDEGLAIENRLLLLQPLIKNLKYIPKPKIHLLPDEIKRGMRILLENKVDLGKPLFMIGILGSSVEKTYPPVYMAKLLDYIVKHTGAQLLFNFIPSQQKEAYALYDLCEESTRKNCFLGVYGRDLRTFLSITAHCGAFIGNEGGAANMAKALNVPTFSIFSPWILKEAWNSYEKNGSNVSVHLKDFNPDIYLKHPKKYKNISQELYLQFPPEWILPELNKFLDRYSPSPLTIPKGV